MLPVPPKVTAFRPGEGVGFACLRAAVPKSFASHTYFPERRLPTGDTADCQSALHRSADWQSAVSRIVTPPDSDHGKWAVEHGEADHFRPRDVRSVWLSLGREEDCARCVDSAGFLPI